MTTHEPKGRALDIYLAHKLGASEGGYEIESEAWYRACAEGRERPCSDRTPTSRARAEIERWISR
jgi:hypothetical protein